MDFTAQSEHRVKIKEIKKRDNYLDLARKLKEAMEHEGDVDNNLVGLKQSSKSWWGSGRVEHRRMS